MANTYTSDQVSSGRVRGNWRGADFTEYGEIAATEAALGDVFELVRVPNGYSVESVILDCDQLDSNATPALVLEVGDSTTAGRYITGATVGQGGGVATNNVAASSGYTPAVGGGSTGQGAGGNAGSTVIQAQVTTAAATFKSGTIRLVVRLFMKHGAFS